MKIAVLVPAWKRPEVLKVAFDHWKNPQKKLRIELFFCFVLSPTDPNYDENLAILSDFLAKSEHDGIIVKADNNPIGSKMNDGLRILQAYKWDYLMNFGSDDILSDLYWLRFYPHLHNRDEYIVMNSVVFVDCIKKEAILATYPIVGAGRLIARRLIDETMDYLGYVYAPKLNSGMDTSSQNNIQSVCTFSVTLVKGAYVADLKTFTNINLYHEIKQASHEVTEIDAARFAEFGDLSAICSAVTKR